MINNRTRHIVLASLGTVLIIVGAWLKISTPLVPITFQLFTVILITLLLGAKLAKYSVLTYLVLGLFGVPVFAGGGGFHCFLLPSFGYIYGFFIAVIVIEWLFGDKELNWAGQYGVTILITTIVYALGMIHMYLVQRFLHGELLSLAQVFAIGLLRTFVKDLILNLFAVQLSQRIRKHLTGISLYPARPVKSSVQHVKLKSKENKTW